MATKFTVVPKPLSNYQELRKRVSPELQEALLNACLSANISEDDWLHCLFTFQGDLFSGALDAQMAAVNKALDAALSDHASKNEYLAKALADCQASSNTVVQTITTDREARKNLLVALQQQLEIVDRNVRDVRQASEIVRNIKLWLILLSFFIGVLMTLSVLRLFFHL